MQTFSPILSVDLESVDVEGLLRKTFKFCIAFFSVASSIMMINVKTSSRSRDT